MTPHRGLPLPAAMTLPSPAQQSSNSLGSQVPPQWQNSEELSRTWFQARIEEDKRKAEEERTKQEQSRVETRRLELDLLREAFRIGIPPPVIPIMFAGGGALKGVGGEWLNEYYAQQMGHLQQQHQLAQQQQAQQHQQQAQQQQQQQQQTHQMPPQAHHSPGPDRKLRREDRVIGQQQFGPPGQPAQSQHMGPPPGAAGIPSQQGPPPSTGYMPTYPISGAPSAPRSGPPIQQQPRPPQSQPLQINTKDMHVHQQPPILPGMPGQMIGTPISTPHGQPIQGIPPPPPPPQPVAAHVAAHAAAQEPPAQSPGIFFHHWVPPNSQSTGMSTPAQATASPQRQLDSPFSHNPPLNQLAALDYVSSPKKRKTATTQSQQQTPSGAPFSPPFHPTPLSAATTPSRTRRGHSRHRSDTTPNARGYEPYGRPAARNRRSTGESPHPESNILGPQLPSVSSAGDNGGGGNGGPHHPREQEHQRQEQQRQDQERQDQQRQDQQRQDQQRQQSVPPPQQIGRPYSAGPDLRRENYPPPPRSEGGGRSKSGNGRD